MLARPKLLSLVYWLCWLVLGPSEARADAQKEAVLLLEIKQDGKYQSQLTRRLEQYIENRGAPCFSTGLGAEERESRDIAVWRRLASKNRAPLILWGEVETLADHRSSVELRLFNLRRGESQPPEFATCADTAVAETVIRLADTLLAKQEQAQSPTLAPVETAAAPAPLVNRPVTRRARPRWRLGLGLGTVVLGAGALVGAVTLTALQGRSAGSGCSYTTYLHPSQPLWDGCHYSNLPLFTAGYIAAAALGVGSWLLLDF